METVEAIGADAPLRGASALRHDWSAAEVEALLVLPFAELMFRAQTVHRRHFDPNQVQMSTLLSIKTAAAPRTAPIVRRAPATIPGSRPAG